MSPPFSVVIPAFNEAIRIADTLRTAIEYLAATSPESELIVVNDGSTDATAEVTRHVLAGHPSMRTKLIDSPFNHGKGAAVRCGLLRAKYQTAAFFDADLSTPVDELPKIITPIGSGEVDVAFGSRAVDRKLIGQHQPWQREQAGRLFNLLVRVATGLPFWDTQCGFKAFNMKTCQPVIAAGTIAGFGFDVELLLLAQRAGLRLREIPVRWNHYSGSKVRFLHDSLEMLREVVALRSRSREGQVSRSGPVL